MAVSLQPKVGNFRTDSTIHYEEAFMFGHEKCGAYHSAIEFAALAAQLIERLPPGYAKLIDQLSRAGIPIRLTIV